MIGAVQGYYYDGVTPHRYDVIIELGSDRQALEITGEGISLRWPLAQLRGIRDQAHLTLTLSAAGTEHHDRAAVRLVVLDTDAAQWLIRTRPNLFAQDHVRRYRGKMWLRVGAAVFALYGLIIHILPALAEHLAQFVPRKSEIALGQTAIEQMKVMLYGFDAPEDIMCVDPKGQAAFAALAQRLTQQANLEYDITLHVVDHDMVNAFAVPGGQIVFSRGLIEMADTPEMVAGVLAHEIGHVESRDSLRLMLRAASSAGLLSMAMGDFSGGTGIALISEQLISSAHSRQAETHADEFAYHMLEGADLDAEPMAEFFRQIMVPGDASSMLQYFASHPASEERAERAQAFANRQEHVSEVLTKDEWAALQNICDTVTDKAPIALGAP